MPKRCLKYLEQLMGADDAYALSEADGQRLENIAERFEKAREAIREGRDAEAADHTRVAEQLVAVEQKIEGLREQLRTGNILIPERKRRVDPTDLADAKIDLARTRREIDNYLRSLRPFTAKDAAVEVSTFLRMAKATADLSASLRQGLFGTVALARRDIARAVRGQEQLPNNIARIYGKALRAWVDARSADYYMLMLKESPDYHFAVKHKLELTELGPGAGLTQGEEMFLSRWARKIPGVRTVLDMSERHYVVLLNLIRNEQFRHYRETHPGATDAELDAYAQWVNWSSGRGSLGNLGTTGIKAANTLLFSPRFSISRVQTVLAPLLLRKQRPVLKQVVADWATLIATGMGILALAKAAGADVGDDPRDADFGKIVLGNQRTDIWGGHVQVVRLLLNQALFAFDREGLFGEGPAKKARLRNLRDEWFRFLSYKSSPPVNFVFELMEQKTVIGEPRSFAETARSAITPIVFEDFEEIWKADNTITAKALASIAAELGVGVSVYSDGIKHQHVAPLMKRAGYRPAKPTYPDKVKNNTRRKRELDEAFGFIVARDVIASRRYLETLSPEDLRSELEQIADRARTSVLGSLTPEEQLP